MPQPTAPTAAADAPEPLDMTGDAALDAKLAALDDDLNPIDPANDPLAKKDEDEEVEEAEDEAEVDEQPEAEEADEADEKEEADKPEDEEDGYILDEEDKLAAEAASKETTQPVALEPKDQYILNGIKDAAVTVRGVVGDSQEVKEYKVLMPEQLPAGFRYIDDREQSIANKAYTLIEQEARRLDTEYAAKQNQTSTNDFTARENLTERQDASALQKAGEIPSFKKNPDLPYGFDSSNYRNVINLLAENKDEAAVLIKDVLDFKDKQNDKYAREYNAGRTYKHIGFDEAYQLFRRQNPTQSNPAQVKEDKARHQLAKRTGNTKGASATKQVAKPHIKQGMTSRELDDYIESLDI
jgi:hypothetical protein